MVTILGTGSILTDSGSPAYFVHPDILIDVGNGVVKQIRRAGLSPASLNTLLITHLHGDHIFDAPFLLLELGLRSERPKPFEVFGPPDTEETMRALLWRAFPESAESVWKNCSLSFSVPNPGSPLRTESGIELFAYAMLHGDMQAYGYRVADRNGSIGFSGDTGLCGGLVDLIEDSDVAIIDASFVATRPDHVGAQDFLKLCEDYPDKRLLPTHMTDAARQLLCESSKVLRDFDVIAIGGDV